MNHEQEEEEYFEKLKQAMRICKAMLNKQLNDGGHVKGFSLVIIDKVDNTRTTITLRPWEPHLN
jgi:hypothetical protein